MSFRTLWRVCFSKIVKSSLKIAFAQVVETSVTNNSPSQGSNHPDDLFQSKLQTLSNSIKQGGQTNKSLVTKHFTFDQGLRNLIFNFCMSAIFLNREATMADSTKALLPKKKKKNFAVVGVVTLIAWHEWFSCKSREWKSVVNASRCRKTSNMKIPRCPLAKYLKKLHQRASLSLSLSHAPGDGH